MKYEIENAFVFDKDGNPVSDIDIDIENALLKGIRGLRDRIDEGDKAQADAARWRRIEPLLAAFNDAWFGDVNLVMENCAERLMHEYEAIKSEGAKSCDAQPTDEAQKSIAKINNA